ncbi:UDP-N-acetylmuramoyl-tripeptide--D-alanyl-D-alanine ligase [Vibrio sp. HA2012]|uniref:UDP-N-acetylmuramoyl-tripeptide--D-alanyl-D- alanine ligase n=1 Tax=Vibrio sp. HA2012 TaxID=1971595 RepID=UPI000C2BD657|nr:UDP-N-acetylmuramoyl-tripeptide--D-alanyl-D-alanine ligase [Vibrio sp. HA2012]PJC84925.1 UDP-N-acetylmuramoyl-tripeptide--D-alanyl-D-alanine ligase [Vibrio sp. HA2012]
MISTSLMQMSQILQATLIGADCPVNSVCTDTRTIEPGALFVALKGERFDAHDFCQQAKEQGAGALLVERKLEVALPQLVVKDTRIALGQLAAFVHKACALKTLAITGSCGKTTVKEMTAAILGQKGKVLYTAGNFNNDIGVPLTLLRCQPEHDYAVIELGANHPGEIAYTTALVQPEIALVNNVAAAHLEGFGSLDGVKNAKGEIYQGLPEQGTAIINLDSHGEALWQDVLQNKQVVTFSMQDPQADYFASDIGLNSAGYAAFLLHTPQGESRVQLNIPGKHNVSNAAAAAALAANAGATLAEIAAGLSLASGVKGRGEVIALTDSVRLIDDSYNASVPAMKAAIDLLATYSGVKWLILGYMAELGEESLELHRQLGEYAAPFTFDYVLTYGDDTRVISELCHGHHFADHSSLIEFIGQQLALRADQKHTLLVKGANSARMSNIAAALKEKHQ